MEVEVRWGRLSLRSRCDGGGAKELEVEVEVDGGSKEVEVRRSLRSRSRCDGSATMESTGGDKMRSNE